MTRVSERSTTGGESSQVGGERRRGDPGDLGEGALPGRVRGQLADLPGDVTAADVLDAAVEAGRPAREGTQPVERDGRGTGGEGRAAVPAAGGGVAVETAVESVNGSGPWVATGWRWSTRARGGGRVAVGTGDAAAGGAGQKRHREQAGADGGAERGVRTARLLSIEGKKIHGKNKQQQFRQPATIVCFARSRHATGATSYGE